MLVSSPHCIHVFKKKKIWERVECMLSMWSLSPATKKKGKKIFSQIEMCGMDIRSHKYVRIYCKNVRVAAKGLKSLFYKQKRGLAEWLKW